MKYINTNKVNELNIEKNNYYVILDFDKTITGKNSMDSWMAVVDFELFGEKGKKEWKELNAKYVPIEGNNKLAKKIKKQYMKEWYQKSMDTLYQYQLTESKLKTALEKENLIFRNGAKEFLQKLQEDNVPVIILSAGIGNAIEEFLKNQGCYSNNLYIISNFIKFQEDKMQKFTDTIIHSMNKNIQEYLPSTWQNRIKEKQYAILCGDILEDIHMVEKEKRNQTLTIAFLNDRIEDNVNIYNQHYDIVLTEKEACFQEVEKIIRKEEW